jgi:membrane fusion protein (multidrug efflux system)
MTIRTVFSNNQQKRLQNSYLTEFEKENNEDQLMADANDKPLKEEELHTPVPTTAPTNGGGDEDIEEVPLFRKKRVIIPLLIILTGMALAGYYWYMNLRDFVSTDDAAISANSIAVSSKILGRIVFLGAEEGDTVKTGQVLVRLDDSDLRAQEASSKASLDLATQSVPFAQVEVNRALEDFSRAAVQYRGKIITKEQYDHAQKTLEGARAQHAIALSKVSTARAQLGIVESELKNTVIVASMDGVVAKRWLLAGDIVQAGQPILTVYDLRNIWVTANLEETKLGNIRLNDPVEISIDAYPRLKFAGRVIEIGNYTSSEFSLIPPNNASGNFTKVTQRVPVKISISGSAVTGTGDPVLRPGMSVEVAVKMM